MSLLGRITARRPAAINTLKSFDITESRTDSVKLRLNTAHLINEDMPPKEDEKCTLHRSYSE